MNPDAENKPLTFKEKMAARKNLPLKENLPTGGGKSGGKSGRDRDDDIVTLYSLLDENLTDWEAKFCDSVIKQLTGHPTYSNVQLSPKQAAIVDKMDKQYLEQPTKDPTPKGNPPMQTAPKSKDVRQMYGTGFGDKGIEEDDDIPF